MRKIFLLLFILISISAYAGDITTGLVGWWKFDETSGGIAHDSSATANDALLIGAPTWTTEGPTGHSLYFHGGPDHVRTPFNAALRLGTRTVSMWVNLTDLQQSSHSLFSWARGSTGYTCTDSQQTYIRYDAGLYAAYQDYGGTVQRFKPISTIPKANLGEWAHWVVVFDGDASNITISGYKNGVLAGTPYTATGGLSSNCAMNTVGTQEDLDNPNYVRSMSGYVADVRVYNRALSTDDITDLYNLYKPTYSDVTAPTVPTDLTATAASAYRINLSWTASTDATGVAGYIIKRGTTILATTRGTGTTYSDYAYNPSSTYQYSLDPSTAYTYSVAAYDAAYNVSAYSSTASATTSAASGTTYTLTVVKAGSGFGTITSGEAGISCGATCTYTFPDGDWVNLTPYPFLQSQVTPPTNPLFRGWTGASTGDQCTGIGQCMVRMTANKTVTAYYTEYPSSYHYISASGDNTTGSSWTTAWTSFPAAASWVRGDTYYVAGGTYTGTQTIPAKTGTDWIYIKKATASDHGTDTGWSAAYGTNPVIINGQITNNSSYTNLDGVTGSGTSGYGIKVVMAGAGYGYLQASGLTNVIVRHVEVQGTGKDTCIDSRGFQSPGGTVSDIYWEYNYIHDLGTNGMTVDNNATRIRIRHNYFSNIKNPTSGGCPHGQAVQLYGVSGNAMSDVDIAYNTYHNTGGTGVLAMLGVGVTYNDIRFHTNIVDSDDTADYFLDGIVYGRDTVTCTNVIMADNTIYNHQNPQMYIAGTASGNYAENNIYVNNYWYSIGKDATTTCRNNYFSGNTGTYAPTSETGQVNGSNPFVSAPTDYHLVNGSTAIGMALNLGSPYNLDMDGVNRSVPWDAGAYEYVDSTAPSISITSPTSFSTYSTDQSTLALAGTASAVSPATISSVTCVNDRGGSCTVSGTTSWTVTAAAISAGVNILTLTATDSNALTAIRTLTVSRYVISSVSYGTPSTTGATITWTTNLPASSQVRYGTTASYGSSSTLDSSQVTSHSVGLIGLAPGTLYHYAVLSAGFLSDDDTFTTDSGAATPILSSVSYSGVWYTHATITWTTDLASDTQVSYGTTTGYGSNASIANSVTSHSITVTGLIPATLYHFTVTSTRSGSTGTVGDYTFTTASAGRGIRRH